jgi:hypothetical protein
MAKTAVNRSLSSSTPYTVPTGKYLIAQTFGGYSTDITVNGVIVIPRPASSAANNFSTGPLCANAGDVIATSNAVTVGMSGFVYDVPA